MVRSRPSGWKCATAVLSIVVLVTPRTGSATNDTIIVHDSFERHSASGCAGHANALFGHCGNPIPALTSGEGRSEQETLEAGRFSFTDWASGGMLAVEHWIAQSTLSLDTSITSDALLSRAIMTATLAVESRSALSTGGDVSVFGKMSVYTGRARQEDMTSPDYPCDDGAQLQWSGRESFQFNDTTPLGLHKLQIVYFCRGDGRIRAGEVFGVNLWAIGLAESHGQYDWSAASLSGQLQRVEWILTAAS